MTFSNIAFVKGAVSLDDCPVANWPEIALAGRSNVGKSSLINALANRKNIAHTSNVPGKTQQMNFYEVDQTFHFVDLPGYGFAKAPEEERKKWGRFIKEYLMERQTLLVTIQLIDIRHKPTKLDEEFIYWMAKHRRPFIIVLNKADKLSGNKQQNSLAMVKHLLEVMNIEVPVIICSSKTQKNITKIKEIIRDFLDSQYLISS